MNDANCSQTINFPLKGNKQRVDVSAKGCSEAVGKKKTVGRCDWTEMRRASEMRILRVDK